MTNDRVSLRDAADLLNLDRSRLLRLGRSLRLAPQDACLPREVIHRARTEVDDERRYRVVMDRLLEGIRTERT